MSVVTDDVRVVHATPGRIRVHLAEWSGGGQRGIEAGLRELKGVRRVQANPLTRNILINFDPSFATVGGILSALRKLLPGATDAPRDAAPPPAIHERQGEIGRSRIAVRGIDRDPALASRVVQVLAGRPGVVYVAASQLTGRVLVLYDVHRVDLEDLLADVANVELPPLPEEDRPRHPLDPGPLLQSATRTVGAGIGLGLLAASRLTGVQVSIGVRSSAARVSAAISILQSVSFVRYGLRRLLGRDRADLLFHVPGITSLALAGSGLGLAVVGAESLRLLTEVLARRAAWRRYEERLGNVATAVPGVTVRLENQDCTPLTAAVVEGHGTAIGRDGRALMVAPGTELPAGSRVYGGPFVVDLQAGEPFHVRPRPAPPARTLLDRYLHLLGRASLIYAGVTALATRSMSRAFAALLLVNPRTAMIGLDTADLGASARVIRSGVTVVGTRPGRSFCLPNLLLLDGPRVLVDGFEVTRALPSDPKGDPEQLLALASAIAAAAGSPWGGALRQRTDLSATDGSFDGYRAQASIQGARYSLSPTQDWDALPAEDRMRHRGEQLLAVQGEHELQPSGYLMLRPRLDSGVQELVGICRRVGVAIGLLPAGDWVSSQVVAHRAGVPLMDGDDAVEAIRRAQADGAVVAFVSDHADCGAAFAASDLAIGLSSGRGGHFPARADLLAPDVVGVAAIVDACARRETSVRDAVALSTLSNVVGGIWGFRTGPSILRATYPVYVTALGALADAWLRLHGGERASSTIARLVDPRPERWGRQSVEHVIRAMRTRLDGLSAAEAAERRQREVRPSERSSLARSLLDQLRSPLTGILGAGAVLSLILGSTADVVMISATIAANVVAGAWQEHQAGRAVAALERIGSTHAEVLRNGRVVTVRTEEVVPGDILVLVPGIRVAADARIVQASGLEVDEAPLTGESLPVSKLATGGTDSSRIVLAGSAVTVGTGQAVVVAVGSRTRMGATAAALAIDETRASPLGIRLNRMLRQVLPLVGAGGLIVFVSGLLRRRPLLPQLAVGAAIAIAAVPEGLPLLAGVGEAAVASRLAGRNALVRRLSAVEALGRVDVACTDKTGTLTEGRLRLQLVATMDDEAGTDSDLSPPLRQVLLTAGRATPHPDAPDAMAHPTDVVVREGAERAGLGAEIRAPREAESPFDPAGPYHASFVDGALSVKGAAEELAPRCRWLARRGGVQLLDATGQSALIERAAELAAGGLRVLMVAEGPGDSSPGDPRELTALGFIGISDPLRADVPDAVRRCFEAGVRVIMLTGDHPATARAIAHEAGLLDGKGQILTGPEIAELGDVELDRRLEWTSVVARVTPLDKLRIVESLQRRGHTVAMTGDGVNDAPALRLADVGVAMGKNGTDAARHAAAIVLADDDFSTLVEALVEGRSFWRNIRRALALLLGGNLGELGLMVGASTLGLEPALVPRQILAVNMVTDILPSLSVALQPPESRHLAALAREGTAALDTPLRNDVLRRGGATALPALVAHLIALRSGGLGEARSVAFGSIVATQLAQTLDAGRAEGSLTRSVFTAVAGSAGILVASLTVSPLRAFLGLVTPSLLGWALIAGGSLIAVALGRTLGPLALPQPRPLVVAPA